MQDALRRLSDYWTERGCLTLQPFNTEVGAGTMNPATVLRVLGPEPWDVAYVEPSVRPDDSRYGENPNRLQTHTQFQVILKPDPGDPQELYLGSLEALGIDLVDHDVRFVEDNWQQPAIGAWGLGWEVWLDGMEITQFTYFQQVGGLNLDPIPVELTYGMERIMMAVQSVNHFKNIVYAYDREGNEITYGEAFGQQEYEMSRYYLDEADVVANQKLYETYVNEATRMVELRLPVPAHTYILKSSHAFNVLDARGAISTTERAQAFSTMRKLMRDTAKLWVERREELGLPLLTSAKENIKESQDLTIDKPKVSDNPETFIFEIGVEELPPHLVVDTIAQVSKAVKAKLADSKLEYGEITVSGTPRRIVTTVKEVAPKETDALEYRKGPKWAAAFDIDGQPTKALQGFMRGQKVELSSIVKRQIADNEYACVAVETTGRYAWEVLSELITETVSGLRAEKNMRWCDPKLSFSRAIRWLVALLGAEVVPAQVSQLRTGRTTYLHRGSGVSKSGVKLGHINVNNADDFMQILAEGQIEIDLEIRRKSVISQAKQLAAEVGGEVYVEAEQVLVDEITNLVETPTGILGSFDSRYLDLPEQILTTVMRKHQRYLPIYRDKKLLNHFITMANGECDHDIVRQGNESVLRARYEDALFFWNADLKAKSPEDFIPKLTKLTFENRLGSMAQRASRIAHNAFDLAKLVKITESEHDTLIRAGKLAKFDLGTQLVVEMSSLAGFVAREYAKRMGESNQVADALYQMEQPRTTSDQLPNALPGTLLSLGDRFDLLMSMFALGAKPTGSSDPYGLRRAALGIVKILRSIEAVKDVTIRRGLLSAAEQLKDQGVKVSNSAIDSAQEFVISRYVQLLRDEGAKAEFVSAILPGADSPFRAQQTLESLIAISQDEEFRQLVTAMNRIDRILPEEVPTDFDLADLTETTEKILLKEVLSLPKSAEDVTNFVSQHYYLVDIINKFFEETLVFADDMDLRNARLGLLNIIRNRIPTTLDLRALEVALA